MRRPKSSFEMVSGQRSPKILGRPVFTAAWSFLVIVMVTFHALEVAHSKDTNTKQPQLSLVVEITAFPDKQGRQSRSSSVNASGTDMKFGATVSKNHAS